jgi:hypothetical protein
MIRMYTFLVIIIACLSACTNTEQDFITSTSTPVSEGDGRGGDAPVATSATAQLNKYGSV